MKKILAAALLVLSSNAALAAAIDYSFPWKNGQARDSIYKTSEHPNAVFVFEAFQNFCPSCNSNAANVDALATAVASNPRIQVLDLALDRKEVEMARWIANHHPNHPVVQDVGQKVFSKYKADNYIPQVFVVACDGTSLYQHTGEWDATVRQEIEAAIAGGLQMTCAAE